MWVQAGNQLERELHKNLGKAKTHRLTTAAIRKRLLASLLEGWGKAEMLGPLRSKLHNLGVAIISAQIFTIIAS